MPRSKEYNQGQSVLLAVSFDRQLLPGTFEYTRHYLLDNKLDLSIFHHKYGNDETGRSVYDPALLNCDDTGLIGKEMFAIDGCKERSGTQESLKKRGKRSTNKKDQMPANCD